MKPTTHCAQRHRTWIPQAAVVDPEQPITLPFVIAAAIHSPCHTPSPFLIPFTSVSTRYHGDGHSGFDGEYRVMSSVQFDWDGHQILNASVPPGPHFGTTVLMGTYTSFLNTNTCEVGSRTATHSTGFSASGSSFAVNYSASTPFVRLPAPPIDRKTTGTIAADGTINLHFHTDPVPQPRRAREQGRDAAAHGRRR